MENLKAKLMDIGLLCFRVLMGLGLARHGYQKVFGDMDKFYQAVGNMGFPAPVLFAWMSALTEFLGGLLLAIGLGTRISGIFVLFNMSVAAFIALGNASINMPNKELALVYWVMAITLILTGPGKYSLDQPIYQWWLQKKKSN